MNSRSIDALEAWRGPGKTTSHKGHRIFYRDSGGENKPVLLLIHGFPTASYDWHAIWAPLAERFRLIAPDMIGFGFSAKPSDYPYQLTDQADLHSALCESLGIQQVHVLAHDYGVSVAQELLARHGQWQGTLGLLSVVFLNGGLFPESHRPRVIQHLLASPVGPLVSLLNREKSFAKSFAAIFGPKTQPSAEELHRFWQLIAENNGHRLMHRLIRYMAERREHRNRWVKAMQGSPVPMRLINGPEDPVSGAHLAERYRQLIPKADVVSLPGIGHYPQVEHPKAVLDAFFAFHAQQAV